MNLRTGLIAGAGLVAGVAMAASAATLADLGARVGWSTPLHWALPVAVDVLALVAGVAWLAAGVSGHARNLGRTLTLVSVVVSVALNAISHLVATRYMTPGPWLVIAVSAVPPLAAALAVHLTAAITTADRNVPGTPDAPEGDTTSDRTSLVVPPEQTTPAKRVVICGASIGVPAVPSRPKLDTQAARKAIEKAHRDGLSIREAARVSTRSPSQVQRVYVELEAKNEEQPDPVSVDLVRAAA